MQGNKSQDCNPIKS